LKSLLLILIFVIVACQQEDRFPENKSTAFCNYFKIDVRCSPFSGKIMSWYPDMKTGISGSDAGFIKKHRPRFDYILYNGIDPFKAKLDSSDKSNLDSSAFVNSFCEFINTDKKFQHYFHQLTNNLEGQSKERFSTTQMMKIAVRFFYWDHVNEKDTSLSARVGINGLKGLERTRDCTVLEAFCFEAVTHRLQPLLKIFRKYGKQISSEAKKEFYDFAHYLETMKLQSFELMEKDEEFRKILMKYYEKNRDNLGFVIE
jgi:hypothetical protein